MVCVLRRASDPAIWGGLWHSDKSKQNIRSLSAAREKHWKSVFVQNAICTKGVWVVEILTIYLLRWGNLPQNLRESICLAILWFLWDMSMKTRGPRFLIFKATCSGSQTGFLAGGDAQTRENYGPVPRLHLFCKSMSNVPVNSFCRYICFPKKKTGH